MYLGVSSMTTFFTKNFLDCTADEFNCQDGNCIHQDFQCNKIAHCLTASDEDEEECAVGIDLIYKYVELIVYCNLGIKYCLVLQKKNEESFWQQVTKLDMLIILIVFFLILFGMCCTLIFNIVRKLIHDFSVIKVNINFWQDPATDQCKYLIDGGL